VKNLLADNSCLFQITVECEKRVFYGEIFISISFLCFLSKKHWAKLFPLSSAHENSTFTTNSHCSQSNGRREREHCAEKHRALAPTKTPFAARTAQVKAPKGASSRLDSALAQKEGAQKNKNATSRQTLD
jgi:hypothetical protein